jgi:hypothetical protein
MAIDFDVAQCSEPLRKQNGPQRMDPSRATIASADRDGERPAFFLSLRRQIGFLQLDDGVTQRFQRVLAQLRV